MFVSLQAYEALRAGAAPASPTTSATALEMLLCVQRATHALPILRARDVVSKGAALDADVATMTAEVVTHVRAELAAPPSSPKETGTHSSAVIVVDASGNVVVGTHTIETLNWGVDLFVGGVPLSTAGPTSFDDPAEARLPMRIDPLSSTLVFKDGAPVATLTVYGTGLHPADVQVLDAVIGRGLDAEEAVLEPRVEYFAYDHASRAVDYAKNSIDPRFAPALLCALRQRGFRLERDAGSSGGGYVDTGFPTLVTIAPGHLHRMTPDMSYIRGVAAGD